MPNSWYHHKQTPCSLKKCRAWAILATCTFERRRLERYCLRQALKSTVNDAKWSRVLSLAKMIEPLNIYAACKNLDIIWDKQKCVIKETRQGWPSVYEALTHWDDGYIPWTDIFKMSPPLNTDGHTPGTQKQVQPNWYSHTYSIIQLSSLESVELEESPQVESSLEESQVHKLHTVLKDHTVKLGLNLKSQSTQWQKWHVTVSFDPHS